jgi:serine/threonine protein kinase/tetratricopeptide (TPR) repeat protein/TolB-like protein
MIGQILGHYRLVEKIGAGGMGVVYRAHDERLDRDVALKVLPPEMLSDAAAVKSFREEARALSKLNHPNIATIHDFDTHDAVGFLVMEYIPGITLDRKIGAGPLPEKEVIRLGVQLALGLQAAHCKGVVHRDLKPSNLRVTPDGRLKILDFGLARLLLLADPDATRSTLDLHPVAGTLPYMSPELLRGELADERSDIYSFGAVLYEIATGQRLFPDKNGPRLIDAILHQSVRSPRELNHQVSSGMQSIILKSVDREAERRYQTAKEVQVDLERLSTGPVAQPERSGPLALEIAHVLYMDIEAYSDLPMDQQRQRIEELQKTVRGSSEFSRAKSADRLISLPSGDGMALVFFDDPEAPCRCALEVSRALRNNSEIKLRMGIHTGPVYRVPDINASRNVAGGGINVAQRVMDCGDSGHILLSKAVADVLAQVSRWKGTFHDLGEAEVKHGIRIHLFNLYNEEAGNPRAPKKLAAKASHKSDSGKHRTPRPGGSRQRSGVKSASEIKGQPVPLQPTEAKKLALPAVRRGLFNGVVRKRFALAGLAAFALALATLVSPGLRQRLFLASPSNTNPAGIPPLTEGKYLAVLPFGVEGDHEKLGPVAEGVSQDLSKKLLELRDVTVASARAAEEVDLHRNLQAVAHDLGVNLILSGTVGGDTAIRITVSLDDVANSRRVFRKQFSGSRTDLLNMEDQIYMQILSALELNPTVSETVRAESRPTDNADAYDLYNKGRSVYRGRPDLNEIKRAIGFYEEAIKKDPSFALAYASVADASLTMYRETQDAVWTQKAFAAAQKAQALDDNLAEAHLSLGAVYRETGRTDEAISQLKRAKQLSPKSDDRYRRLGRVYEDAGKYHQAAVEFQNAITINPFYWFNYLELGDLYFQAGEFTKALTAYRKVVELESTNPLGHQNIGAAYFLQGKFEESIPEFENAIALKSSDASIYSNLGLAYLYLKRYPEGLEKLRRAAEMRPNDELIAGNLADGYRWSRQKKKSIEEYNRAIALANKDLKVNPRNATALGSLGLYYAKKGDTSLARHCIHRARSIDASDVQLIYNEAVILALANQSAAALESLRSAIDKGISPEQPMLDPEFTSLHGNPDFEKLIQGTRGKLK